MMSEFIEPAAKLVRAYRESKNSHDFAGHLARDPASSYMPREVEFYWELIDAAFDAGVCSTESQSSSLPPMVPVETITQELALTPLEAATVRQMIAEVNRKGLPVTLRIYPIRTSILPARMS